MTSVAFPGQCPECGLLCTLRRTYEARRGNWYAVTYCTTDACTYRRETAALCTLRGGIDR